MFRKTLKLSALLGMIFLLSLAAGSCGRDVDDVLPSVAVIGRIYLGLSRGTQGEWYLSTWHDGNYDLIPFSGGTQGNARNLRPASTSGATTAFPSVSPTGQGVYIHAAEQATVGTPSVAGTIYMPDSFTNSVLVVDATTFQQTGKIPLAGEPFDVVISPDRSTLYAATFPPAGGTAAAITIISTAAQTITGTIPLPGSYPQWLAISPDGSTLYCADNQTEYATASGSPVNQLLAIDLTSKTVKQAIHASAFAQSYIGRPVASPDGSTVYAPALNDLVAIDTASLQPASDIFVSLYIGSQPVAHTPITPDGRYLYVPTFSGVQAVDTATGKSIASITLPGSSPLVQDVAVANNGGAIIAVDGVSGNIYQIDPITNTVAATLSPAAGITPGVGTNMLLVMQ
ncbi:MAG TPA: hypothetical protein VMB03_02745 [Bryobacteraceae bacterium]|nr:hypothetical protein [Bryobacteraceae bacterium]